MYMYINMMQLFIINVQTKEVISFENSHGH